MKNKGFSLVELIVVIAIMAILVGVAVPVYTSYISKAQKNKDIQMVDEIKHAVEIAAIGDKWSTTLEPGVVGTIVITDEGMTVNDEDDTNKLLEKAMTDTFGDYASLKLSYDEWTGTLNAGNITYITSSSYYNNVPQLMGDIQNLTNSLKDYVMTDSGKSALGTNFTKWLTDNNINTSDSQAVANAATLYVAQNMTGIANAEDAAAKDGFVTLWTTHQIGNLMTGSIDNVSLLSMVAAEYARAEAIINYLNCTDAREAFVKHSVAGTTTDEVVASIGTIMNEVSTHVDNCTAGCNGKIDQYFVGETDKNDAMAYLALLGQVNESEDVVLSNVGNSNLYSGDALTPYITSYVSAAEVMKDAEDGDVVIVAMMNANGTVNVNVYPMDYTK